MRRFIALAIMLAPILAVASLFAPAALAETLQVCPSGCAYSSIQDAIDAASPGSTIMIGRGTYTENLTIDKSLTLQGQGFPPPTIDGSQNTGQSVVSISGDESVDVTLRLLVITGGMATDGNGGGVSNFGASVTLDLVVVRGNTATGSQETETGFGGGVFSFAGSLTMQRTLVTNNHATVGGGVASFLNFETGEGGGDATFTQTIISNNVAELGAGGITTCGHLVMNQSAILGNSASNGGGLTNCGHGMGYAELNNTAVVHNEATGAVDTPNPDIPDGLGGGISNGNELVLNSSLIAGNTAAGPGGGVFNLIYPEEGTNGTVTNNGSVIQGNQPDNLVNFSVVE